ncbi:L-aspartate oxidase [Eubacteriales bacterium mix99]
MSEYLIDFDTADMQRLHFDTVIVGGGIAGLTCALHLPRSMKTVVLCKGKWADCDSFLAQGGIAASIGRDDRELHIRDTIRAGCGINDMQAVRILVKESELAIRSLADLGVPFDRGPDGAFLRSLEGGHSVKRILHVHGDATGKGIMDVLTADCADRENIRMMEHTFALDLITDQGRCIGLLAENGGKLIFLTAAHFVLATGGIGQLYPISTNSLTLTGDGIAMAYRAGARTTSMEFVQFHPTALYTAQKPERAFLISEAVRGEGAILLNSNGERFMPLYDERLELAPRDIVARAIYDQMIRTDSPCVYLDITGKGRNFLAARFPTIYAECKKNGIDMAVDRIPVAPCEHYFMGGIQTDTNGRTSLAGLYAVGECASTGVHGANRLASNSLLEAVVFGSRAADAIAGCSEKTVQAKNYRYDGERKHVLSEEKVLREQLRSRMQVDAGILRNGRNLRSALEVVEDMQNRCFSSRLVVRREWETADMYETAGLILHAAAENRHSIGSHFIADEKEKQ